MAGNGPSLKNIDYSRLPKDFDVFRCNQFFFEDKYYLGKNVTGYFMGRLSEQLFPTSVVLESRKEYFYDDRYYVGLLFEGIHDRRRIKKLQSPTLIKSFDILEKNEKIKKFLAEQFITYDEWPTTGLWMILTAIVMGYTDIYFVGVDLYSGDSLYAYNNYQPSNLISICKNNSNALDGSHHHSLEHEYAAIELIKTFENITIQTISPDNILQDIFPLAPVQNDSPYIPEDKPENYLNDIVLTARKQIIQNPTGLKQKFNEKGLAKEWEFLREFWLTKFLFQSAKFVYVCLKVIKALLTK